MKANYPGCLETAACLCVRCVAFADAQGRKEAAAINKNAAHNFSELAISEGSDIARRFFKKRGDRSEVHLSEIELAALLAIAFDRAERMLKPKG
jgi:hypothetical protein